MNEKDITIYHSKIKIERIWIYKVHAPNISTDEYAIVKRIGNCMENDAPIGTISFIKIKGKYMFKSRPNAYWDKIALKNIARFLNKNGKLLKKSSKES